MAANSENGLYIPAKILNDDQIGSTQKLVYAVMVAEMDEFSVCRLSARKLGDMLGITHVAAQNARLTLSHLGYIRLIPKTQRNYKILHFRKKRRSDDA